MKNKFSVLLLCIVLLLTFSLNATATISPNDQQATNSIVDEKINLDKYVNTNSSRSQTPGIVSGGIYRIKNVGSGKYMNVHYGVDANGTNVYQWTADGSVEQNFKIIYSEEQDTYMIFAMCSSNGSNRVLNVATNGGSLAHGQNINLYSATSPSTQQMKIISLGENQYRISMASNQNLYLAAYGNSNGTSGGTSSTSAGNIYLSNYVGEPYQHWMFEVIELPSSPSTPIGYLDTITTSNIVGWAYQGDHPNTALEVHIYITNNSTGEQNILVTTANIYRADLESAGYGNGQHGFNCSISWKTYKPGTYTIRAYAIAINGSNNPELTNVKTYTVRNMEGMVDYVNTTKIVGWVWKPDAPESPIDVHIYIYGSNGAQLARYTTLANWMRTDLINMGIGNGVHGFSYSIDWSQFPQDRLRIAVYALDGSNDNRQIYQGYYYNGIEEPDYIWPTMSTRITQTFTHYTHNGIDIGALTRYVAGDPIYCFDDGYIVRSERSDSYGWVVYVNHINPDPTISTYIQTRYAHMMSQPLVSKNTNITKGTVIGYMGDTGDSDGVHLHFETRKTPVYDYLYSEDKSYCIDPLTYFYTNGNPSLYNINSNTNNQNPWGITFDINEIEIDVYDRVNRIEPEENNQP